MKSNPAKLLSYPLLVVEWLDASRLSDGWMDLDAIPEVYMHKCVSVGFLVSENKDGKILVPTVGDIGNPSNRHTYGGMMIPRKAIISEKFLK